MAAPTRQLPSSSGRFRRAFDGVTGGAGRFARLTTVAVRSLVDDVLTPTSAADQVMTRNARTFRFAARFLPSRYREPTIHLYAFFRVLDDLVDESGTSPVERSMIVREIDEWGDWIDLGMVGASPRPAIGAPLAQIVDAYAIPTSCFNDFLTGLRSDLDHRPPADRIELERYSYQVASTVGIAMAHIFGSTAPRALDAAIHLGIAMQITNILRDIGGDLVRDRVYIPTDLLATHQLRWEDIHSMLRAASPPDHRMVGVVKTMINWADEHYRTGIDGVSLLPNEVQVPILLSARLYQRILRQLERNGYDSIHSRVATTRFQKFVETGSCLLASDILLQQEADDRSLTSEVGERGPQP